MPYPNLSAAYGLPEGAIEAAAKAAWADAAGYVYTNPEAMWAEQSEATREALRKVMSPVIAAAMPHIRQQIARDIEDGHGCKLSHYNEHEEHIGDCLLVADAARIARGGDA